MPETVERNLSIMDAYLEIHRICQRGMIERQMSVEDMGRIDWLIGQLSALERSYITKLETIVSALEGAAHGPDSDR